MLLNNIDKQNVNHTQVLSGEHEIIMLTTNSSKSVLEISNSSNEESDEPLSDILDINFENEPDESLDEKLDDKNDELSDEASDENSVTLSPSKSDEVYEN